MHKYWNKRRTNKRSMANEDKRLKEDCEIYKHHKNNHNPFNGAAACKSAIDVKEATSINSSLTLLLFICQIHPTEAANIPPIVVGSSFFFFLFSRTFLFNLFISAFSNEWEFKRNTCTFDRFVSIAKCVYDDDGLCVGTGFFFVSDVFYKATNQPNFSIDGNSIKH